MQIQPKNQVYRSARDFSKTRNRSSVPRPFQQNNLVKGLISETTLGRCMLSVVRRWGLSSIRGLSKALVLGASICAYASVQGRCPLLGVEVPLYYYFYLINVNKQYI